MAATDKTLRARLESQEATIAIIGLGYVGLPLAVEFARHGFSVVGIEQNPKRVAMVNRGENYISDVFTEDLSKVVAAGRLKATETFEGIKEADAILICVPTPLDKNKQPYTYYIEHVVEQSLPYLKPGQLIVLESTTYPGTTEEIIQTKMESTGLEVGKDIYLAFSPERVDPGNPGYKTANTPKIVGGVTAECTAHAIALYEQVISARVVAVSSPRAAEMTKLLENVFRIVNISLVNELARLCERMSINIWEVIEAAKTKPFGYMPFYPGPGLGGHCIPLDPFYLSWKAKEYDFTTRFIDLAGQINDSMPSHVVKRVGELLNGVGKPIQGAKILLLGMAYKKDIDDLRQSPALKIARLLSGQGANLAYHDPWIPRVDQPSIALSSVELSDDVISSQDIVVIMTAHSSVDYERVVKQAALVFDTRNATEGLTGDHLFKLGVGTL